MVDCVLNTVFKAYKLKILIEQSAVLAVPPVESQFL